jgi:hypothetical protein
VVRSFTGPQVVSSLTGPSQAPPSQVVRWSGPSPVLTGPSGAPPQVVRSLTGPSQAPPQVVRSLTGPLLAHPQVARSLSGPSKASPPQVVRSLRRPSSCGQVLHWSSGGQVPHWFLTGPSYSGGQVVGSLSSHHWHLRGPSPGGQVRSFTGPQMVSSLIGLSSSGGQVPQAPLQKS